MGIVKPAARHELKYLINEYEYHAMKNILKYMLKEDPHMADKGQYKVSSLYFDDIFNTAYNQKLAGIEKRCKYRIRIYDGRDSMIRLEKKMKSGAYVSKESAALTRRQYNGIVEGDCEALKYSSQPLLKEFYSLTDSVRLSPRVIVEYDREAYTETLSDIRVTFDKNLRTAVNSLDLFYEARVDVPALLQGTMIVEVKYNGYLPLHIRNTLTAADKQSMALSKFILCRDKLCYIKGVV